LRQEKLTGITKDGGVGAASRQFQRRVFNSPGLADGQEFYYILRAQVVRDGKPWSKTKRVLRHAGDVIETSFLEPGDLIPA